MRKYEQESIPQNFTEQDICCTREDWINCGRALTGLYDQRDSNGQWQFLSVEGTPLLQLPATASELSNIFARVGNKMIKAVLNRAIEPNDESSGQVT